MNHVFLRTVAVNQDPASTDHATLLRNAAGNTGNMLFETALDRQLPDNVVRTTRSGDIPEDLDILILSMSNFISPATDMGTFANVIETKRVKRVVMIGCGAQAHGFDIKAIDLKPGTRRFLDVLAERSVSLGVRGEYTAELLNNMGYKNLSIIGCPSGYWPMEAGWHRFSSPAGLPSELGFHCTPTGKYRDSVGALFRYGLKHSMYYLAQTEISYMMSDRSRDFLYYSRDGAAGLHAHFQKYGRIFYSLDEWIRFNSGLSFVMGSRFHGNIVTMLAGRPCLNMVFDTRTREMIEHFNLPYIHFDHFDEDRPVEHYMELADFSLFHAAYGRRLLEYMDFLDANGVPHRIGEIYHRDTGSFSPLQKRRYKTLVRDAVGACLSLKAFEVALDRSLYEGRSAEQRNAVE